MSTIFTSNPIRVNLISINNTIKQSVIFIGIVPNDVKSELIKIEKDGKNIKSDNSILSKFYGRNWVEKLGVGLQVMKSIKKGGDEFSFDDPDEITEDVAIEDMANEIINDDSQKTHETEMKLLSNSREPVGESIITMDELINVDNDIDSHSVGDGADEQVKKIKQITETEGKTVRIKFIFSDPFVSIYPEDKVLEFKKKIYAILNIPIFRQHIWYVYQGRTFPLSYSIYDDNSLKYINVQDMLSKYSNKDKSETSLQLIENIPVAPRFYQAKNNLKVTTDDTFSILEDYYYKYGITEYNLLDLNDFIEPSRKTLAGIISERYQLELIYYGFIIIYWPMLSLAAFSDFIKSAANIPKFYPELEKPRQELIQIYKLEKNIMDTRADLLTNSAQINTLKTIRGTIVNSIVYSTISVLKYQNDQTTILFIRNLFDKFSLNDDIISAKCYMLYNGKKIILNKSYGKNMAIRENIELDSIMFKIKVPNVLKPLSLSFFKNGNYVIKAFWNEEDNNDFNDIFRAVKTLIQPIIEKINSFGDSVLAYKKTLPIMSKTNTRFTEIGMSMFYKEALTDEQFDVLKSIMADYRKAGIVSDRLSDKSSMEYHFNKGMYQFQSNRIDRVATTRNYYEFLTDGTVKQKWYTVFEKSRITKLHHRFADIKIEIIGVKEKEFFIFYNFILALFKIYGDQIGRFKTASEIKNKSIKRNKPKDSMNQKSMALQQKDMSSQQQNQQQNQQKNLSYAKKLKKTLRNLKEQDPVLYNFKKLYKTENTYSTICQKKHQPLLLDKAGYDQLAPEKKKNATKYWNFTTNKDAYYSCPNDKYPYIKFIIKRHPKDYCIPCCVKTQISEATKSAKKIIHDICLKEHKYTQEERTITRGSRYIMSYGKYIEPGRLSRLPEDSLEPLFYETYSVKDQGIDQECVSTDGYYLYGIDQHNANIKNIGIINILIHATENTLIDFITNIIKIIKISPNKFAILLDGKINKYFKNLQHFITSVNDIFLVPNAIDTYADIPWNDIFINIAYLFLNINIIQFRHKKNDSIKLLLPSYITTTDQLLSNEFTSIIVFKKHETFYPIYLLNTDMFFKSKLFIKKIFEHNDAIITIISRLAETYFNEQIRKKVVDNINLLIIAKFVKNSSYKINKLFVNSSNMCYYVNLKSAASKDIYLPIELSYNIETIKCEITYDVFLRSKYKMSIESMVKFINDFNHWIATKSEKAGMLKIDADKNAPIEERVQPIYPYIKINNWIVMEPIDKKISPSSKIIGFISHNINYYISDINLSAALKIQKKKLVRMLYDPDTINLQIFQKTKAIYDNRCNKIGKSLYNTNLYQIVLLEFMTFFNNQRNNTLRQKIKKKMLGDINKDFDELMREISELIPNCDDYSKLKNQIFEYINGHRDRNILFADIDDSFYNFDRELFEKIKGLPRDKLYAELFKTAQKFIKFGNIDNIKDFEFPNMFISCQSKLQERGKYCSDNKLLIDKNKLKGILEIMASDILNPVKEKWIFSSVFSNNTINFFKFIRYPNEIITIEIED